ncbi:MAG TPA: hypothetical protein VHB50_16085, partial [Bryobacteraceae bacterium]|nr:hypothetical protein [Bryobacteraceae bacterium]
MKTAAHAEDDAIVHSSPPAPTAEEIGVQLRLILASPVFHGSKRCQQFLEYVCRKALAGDAGALKDRSIAVDVFGRSPDTAANGEDTIVRVGAREVRKRLAQYYVTPEGAASQIMVDLPPGSYAPEFRYSAAGRAVSTPAAPATVEIVAPPPAPEPPAAPKKRHRIWIVAAVCVAILAFGAITASKWTGRDVRDTAFERFWAPVFKSSSPLLIGVGHPIVYQPSRRASLLNAKRLPPTPFPIQRKLELPPKDL